MIFFSTRYTRTCFCANKILQVHVNLFYRIVSYRKLIPTCVPGIRSLWQLYTAKLFNQQRIQISVVCF